MKSLVIVMMLIGPAMPALAIGGKPIKTLLECPTAKEANFSTTPKGKVRRCAKEPLPGMVGR